MVISVPAGYAVALTCIGNVRFLQYENICIKPTIISEADNGSRPIFLGRGQMKIDQRVVFLVELMYPAKSNITCI